MHTGPAFIRPQGFEWKKNKPQRKYDINLMLNFSPFNFVIIFDMKSTIRNGTNQPIRSVFTIHLLFIAHILCCCSPRKYSVISCAHSVLNSCWNFDHFAASWFMSNTMSTSSKRIKFVKLSGAGTTWCGWSATNGTGWMSFDPWALISRELLLAASELLFLSTVSFRCWCVKLSPKMCTANNSTVNAVRNSNPNIMKRFFMFSNLTNNFFSRNENINLKSLCRT